MVDYTLRLFLSIPVGYLLMMIGFIWIYNSITGGDYPIALPMVISCLGVAMFLQIFLPCEETKPSVNGDF